MRTPDNVLFLNFRQFFSGDIYRECMIYCNLFTNDTQTKYGYEKLAL